MPDNPDIQFRPATLADLDALLLMMRHYYDEDGYTFVESRARAAAASLIEDPALGRLLMIEQGATLVGYLVITFGFSLEYQGRDAFIDEVFVFPAWRGGGLGARAVEMAERVCAAAGVNALHLEAERSKPRLRGFYQRHGFVDNDRYLLTKWLVRKDAAR